jgi:hypothetical protein
VVVVAVTVPLVVLGATGGLVMVGAFAVPVSVRVTPLSPVPERVTRPEIVNKVPVPVAAVKFSV